MNSVLEQQLQEIQIQNIKDSGITTGAVSEVFRTGMDDIDGLSDASSPAKITHSSPDKITVYSTKDGTPSEILVYMLAKVMRRKLPNGKVAFTLRKEDAPTPINANLKCFLHEDSPWKAEVDQIGLGYVHCPKENLPSVWQQERHGQTKHAEAWKALQKIRELARDEENRALMRAQTHAMQSMAGVAPAPVPAGPTVVGDVQIFHCPDCHRFFDTAQGVSVHSSTAHAKAKAS